MSTKITLDMSREAVVEHVAKIMRDGIAADFHDAPAPEWAVTAAEKVVLFFEVQVAQRLSQEDRLLRAAYRWLNYLDTPDKTPEGSMAVLAQWSARVDELLGPRDPESGSSKPPEPPTRCHCGEVEQNRVHHETRSSFYHPFEEAHDGE